MLNAHETRFAIEKLRSLRDATTEQGRTQYRDSHATIKSEFREYLGKTHAPTLPVAVQDLLWNKAQEVAYAYSDFERSHYERIEVSYLELVEFLKRSMSLM